MPNAILPVLLILPVTSSLLKIFVIWIVSCCSFNLKTSWRLLLSPFIFTQVKVKEEQSNGKVELSNEINGQVNNTVEPQTSKKCHFTTTGKYHIIFDVTSVLENAALVTSGAIGLKKIESSFQMEYLIGIVIGTHVLGLLMKGTVYILRQ